MAVTVWETFERITGPVTRTVGHRGTPRQRAGEAPCTADQQQESSGHVRGILIDAQYGPCVAPRPTRRMKVASGVVREVKEGHAGVG